MNNKEYKKQQRAKMKEIKKFNSKMYKKYNKDKKLKNVPESHYTVTMRDENNILEFHNLQTHFFTDTGTVKAVDGVSFDIPRGATVGVVGESGCGKSVTSLSIMRLLQGPQGQIVGGEIRFNNKSSGKAVDIAKLPLTEMQKLRGNEISMIFQEPMTSLNPVFTIGDQLAEPIMLHDPKMKKADVETRVIELLKLVGIANPEGIVNRYPHELSGGMKQRIVIAMALCCDPQLIVADEPTTALDVTIQAQILDLLRDLKDKINASIMLITHDLGVVASMCDYVVVMYAGRVIEKGTVHEIFKDPKHPYTIGLIKSLPSMNEGNDKLYSIPGNVPNPINMPNHCYFKNRCDKCNDECFGDYPPIKEITQTHKVSCHLYK
ncbi:ABC transporter ATP-binding protein [Clostridium sp. NSJ-145]|nr:ABC transporter ATP-binding protein [Clostridium sp. NSJ-145]MCD2502605.1 ABC transporter ATP-binding protein [Clostridium sp. NSJ-145]